MYYSGGIETEDIRKTLTAMIPDYMILNIYVKETALPQNMNGKIDRVLLKEKMEEL